MNEHQMCGNCAFWRKKDSRIAPVGFCAMPLPSSVDGCVRRPVLSTSGTDCGVWRGAFRQRSTAEVKRLRAENAALVLALKESSKPVKLSDVDVLWKMLEDE